MRRAPLQARGSAWGARLGGDDGPAVQGLVHAPVAALRSCAHSAAARSARRVSRLPARSARMARAQARRAGGPRVAAAASGRPGERGRQGGRARLAQQRPQLQAGEGRRDAVCEGRDGGGRGRRAGVQHLLDGHEVAQVAVLAVGLAPGGHQRAVRRLVGVRSPRRPAGARGRWRVRPARLLPRARPLSRRQRRNSGCPQLSSVHTTGGGRRAGRAPPEDHGEEAVLGGVRAVRPLRVVDRELLARRDHVKEHGRRYLRAAGPHPQRPRGAAPELATFTYSLTHYAKGMPSLACYARRVRGRRARAAVPARSAPGRGAPGCAWCPRTRRTGPRTRGRGPPPFPFLRARPGSAPAARPTASRSAPGSGRPGFARARTQLVHRGLVEVQDAPARRGRVHKQERVPIGVQVALHLRRLRLLRGLRARRGAQRRRAGRGAGAGARARPKPSQSGGAARGRPPPPSTPPGLWSPSTRGASGCRPAPRRTCAPCCCPGTCAAARGQAPRARAAGALRQAARGRAGPRTAGRAGSPRRWTAACSSRRNARSRCPPPRRSRRTCGAARADPSAHGAAGCGRGAGAGHDTLCTGGAAPTRGPRRTAPRVCACGACGRGAGAHCVLACRSSTMVSGSAGGSASRHSHRREHQEGPSPLGSTRPGRWCRPTTTRSACSSVRPSSRMWSARAAARRRQRGCRGARPRARASRRARAGFRSRPRQAPGAHPGLCVCAGASPAGAGSLGPRGRHPNRCGQRARRAARRPGPWPRSRRPGCGPRPAAAQALAAQALHLRVSRAGWRRSRPAHTRPTHTCLDHP